MWLCGPVLVALVMAIAPVVTVLCEANCLGPAHTHGRPAPQAHESSHHHELNTSSSGNRVEGMAGSKVRALPRACFDHPQAIAPEVRSQLRDAAVSTTDEIPPETRVRSTDPVRLVETSPPHRLPSGSLTSLRV